MSAIFVSVFGGALATFIHAGHAEDINVVERATSDAVLDIGAKGDSTGDILTFGNEIYDADNKNKLGTNNGWCVRTVVGKAWECFWTLTLQDGQITVAGPFTDGKDSVLAVTGGTGKYQNTKGEMLLHSRDAQGTAYDFKYHLAD
ncbi:MAG: allene oxide cyclase family protein [Anaerolineales bacterium]